MKAVEEDEEEEEDHDEDHPHPWTLNNSCRRRSRLYSILSDILASHLYSRISRREDMIQSLAISQFKNVSKRTRSIKYKKRRKAIQRLNLEKEEEEGF